MGKNGAIVKAIAADPYLKERKSPTEADQQLYLKEVSFFCPLCGKDLRNKRQRKNNKLYEIAHMYVTSYYPYIRDLFKELEGINGFRLHTLSLQIKCCNNHLPDESWYEVEFEFIEDVLLRKRIIEEFRGIRFAYKLYEGIEAKAENQIFEVRHQIFAYATIYEAVLHYVLYTYYNKTEEFHNLQYYKTYAKVDIPATKLMAIKKALTHDGKDIIPMYIKERKKEKYLLLKGSGLFSPIC